MLTIRVTGISSPGFAVSVRELSRIRMACFWIPTAVLTLTGTGYRVLRPPEVSIQTSGKYIPLCEGAWIENVIVVDCPGPRSPTRSKSLLMTLIPFPSRWIFWILTLMSVVFVVPELSAVNGPVLSLIEAVAAVFWMVTLMVPMLSGIMTDGLTV